MEVVSDFSGEDSDDELIYHRNILRSDLRTPKKLYLLALWGSIGGFLFGYDTGVVSNFIMFIIKDFDLGYIWHKIFVLSTVVTAVIFSVIGGYFSDVFGRKPVILFSCGFFSIGSFLLGLALNKVVFLLGRILVGMGVGIASACIPVYIAESCPTEKRTTLVALNQLCITIGQLVSTFVSGWFSHVNQGWRLMFGASLLPALVQFVGFIFLPESPRFLVKKGKFHEAFRVLAKIRSHNHAIDKELEDVKFSISTQGERHIKGWAKSLTFGQRIPLYNVRFALMIGCVLQIVQQITGFNAIMFYSNTIIKMTGFGGKESVIFWLSIGASLVSLVFTLLGSYLVGCMSRRKLLFVSILGVIFSLILLIFSFNFFISNQVDEKNGSMKQLDNETSYFVTTPVRKCYIASNCYDCVNLFSRDDTCIYCVDTGVCFFNRQNVSSNNASFPVCASRTSHASADCPNNMWWLPILALCLYVISFASGLSLLPCIVNSEIYPLSSRSLCNGIAASANWMRSMAVAYCKTRFTTDK